MNSSRIRFKSHIYFSINISKWQIIFYPQSGDSSHLQLTFFHLLTQKSRNLVYIEYSSSKVKIWSGCEIHIFILRSNTLPWTSIANNLTGWFQETAFHLFNGLFNDAVKTDLQSSWKSYEMSLRSSVGHL